MTLQQLCEQLPDYAVDIKLNLSSVLSDQSGLNEKQIIGIALASSYTINAKLLIQALLADYSQKIDENMIRAAKAAASIMAMNNVYYRFVHLTSDKEFQTMPAKLRMNIIANSGVEKVDFEMYALAVSAINGCGLCIDSHVKALEKAGISKQAIQHVIRIAAVINSVQAVIKIAND
ncbi:MAG: alkyl hydroperoxide reductase [Gammaproteobacteria bacterium RIFCSPHIGHO2_12_FULL_35_23]|nr:MAG: alkyl hydroperoxide reductase [Gammaproteobacteria bacterium RIFCSPHIGHO2_12_FULL_35_23]